MDQSFLDHLDSELEQLKTEGLFKEERVLESAQSSSINANQQSVLNLCANNYLGLANHQDLIKAGQNALDQWGFGVSSVRFICGTQKIHKQLEQKISSFLATEDTILYSSCFDANTGLFETLLGPEDAIISDSLNHASIIDGVRLCKAKRFRYKNNDMKDLEQKLIEAKDARFKLICTDGVFSMDGIIADLGAVVELAKKYNALTMVDDSHAVGFIGEGGRGTPEYCGVQDDIDVITGTLGKALGGASGGYTSGRRPIIDWLRQRSRPYLFSNSLAPMIAAASTEALDLVSGPRGQELRRQLNDNSTYFRAGLERLGFNLVAGQHPIIPVMVGDAQLAKDMASELLKEGVYVIGFSFPVVPRGLARIRTQMSSAFSRDELDVALAAFEKVGRRMKLIS